MDIKPLSHIPDKQLLFAILDSLQKHPETLASARGMMRQMIWSGPTDVPVEEGKTACLPGMLHHCAQQCTQWLRQRRQQQEARADTQTQTSRDSAAGLQPLLLATMHMSLKSLAQAKGEQKLQCGGTTKVTTVHSKIQTCA